MTFSADMREAWKRLAATERVMVNSKVFKMTFSKPEASTPFPFTLPSGIKAGDVLYRYFESPYPSAMQGCKL